MARVPDAVVPLRDAENPTEVALVTCEVVTVKVPLVWPPRMVTVMGPAATLEPPASETVTPDAGARPEIWITPVAGLPPWTLDGLNVTDRGTGPITFSVAESVGDEGHRTVTSVSVATAVVVAANETLL